MHISKFNILDSCLAHAGSIRDKLERQQKKNLQLVSFCSLNSEMPMTWQSLSWQLLVRAPCKYLLAVLFLNQKSCWGNRVIHNSVSEIAYFSPNAMSTERATIFILKRFLTILWNHLICFIVLFAKSIADHPVTKIDGLISAANHWLVNFLLSLLIWFSP